MSTKGRAGRDAGPANDAPTADVRAVLDAFRRIVQALRLGARDGEARAGVSSAELFALQQIGEHPGASVNEIAARTFTHQSSVSVVIQRLVTRGLVDRLTATDDRRRQELALTAAGRRALKRAPAAVQEKVIEAIAALPPKQRRTLAASLSEIARLVDPQGADRHAPMLFEERREAAGRRKTAAVSRTSTSASRQSSRRH